LRKPADEERSVRREVLRKDDCELSLLVASTLALHPSASSWLRVIEWDSVPSNSDHAIADGVLRVLPYPHLITSGQKDPGDWDELLKFIEDREGFVEMVKRFQDLATWEMKSLSMAPEGVMEAIMNLPVGTSFPWVKCLGVKCKKRGTTYGLGNNPPDATATPWNIPSDVSSSGPQDLPAADARDKLERSSCGSERQIQPPSQGIQESTSVQSKSIGKRKRVDDDLEDKNKSGEAPPSGSQGPSTPHKRRQSSHIEKRQRGPPSSQASTSMQDGDDEDDNSDFVPSKTRGEDLVAEKYLQHVTVSLFLCFQESILSLIHTGLGPGCAYRFHPGLLACGLVGIHRCSPSC
jgi:hypothetical protein